MCGFAGFASTRPLPAGLMQEMTDMVRHRGPDDEGFVFFTDGIGPAVTCGGSDTLEDVYRVATSYSPTRRIEQVRELRARVALGFRRLSIIDLSARAHQPMCTADGRYWIVSNCEIYNYLELRRDLESEGVRFVSQSDTEVILAAYRRWGETCLHRFNGMWAFAIYDAEDGNFFLARDRFGVKPLYYWRSTEGVFAFASEVKQLTVMPGWSARLNPATVREFLDHGMLDYSTDTLLKGVSTLAGGASIAFQLDDITSAIPQPRRWYRLEPATVTGSLDDAAAQFRSLFVDSVRLRLHSDVPVGATLSGGLDSSAIVCAVRDLLRSNGSRTEQYTFSACSDDQRFDERQFINQVLEHTGARAHYAFPELDSMLDQLRTIVWHQDAPLGGATVFAEWEVYRLASAAGIKVTLDGHGADEILGGYHSFFYPYIAGFLTAHHWTAALREASAIRELHRFGRDYFIRAAAHYYLPASLRQKIRRLLGREQPTSWTDIGALDGPNPHSLPGLPEADSIRALSIQQLLSTSLPPQLRSCDRDSMAHGIESRAPFLDYRLVEFATGCAENQKINRGITKVVLRRAMRDSLPAGILSRYDKMGFVTPEYAWICESHSDLFSEMAAQAVRRAEGIVRPAAARYAKEVIQGKRPFDLIVWRLITFAHWLDLFDVA